MRRLLLAVIGLILGNLIFANLSVADELLLTGGTQTARFAGLRSVDELEFVRGEGDAFVVASNRLIRYGNEPVVDFASGLLLVDGSLIVGRIDRLWSQQVSIVGTHFRTSVSLRNVRAVALQMPLEPTRRAELMRTFLEADGGDDQLLSVAGDQITGVLETAETRGDALPAARSLWRIRRGDRLREVPAASLRGVVLSPLLHPLRLPEAGFLFGFSDGSRLAVRSIDRSGGQIVLDLACGERLPFDGSWEQFLSAVRVIQPAQASRLLLSERKPAAFKQQSTMSHLSWPLGVDMGSNGQPLVVGGYRYRHGLAMHANSQAAYVIPSDARQFQALIGLNSAAVGKADPGSVVFQVMAVDASRSVVARYTSPVMRSTDEAISVNLDLRGAELVALIVTDAGDGSAGDHAVWLEARFLAAAD